VAGFTPAAGDIVWLLSPHAGQGQAGHRPAVVLSPTAYNGKTGLLLCCPMTTRVKGYPFEVSIAGDLGVALADQVKNLDWRARKASRKGRVSDVELAEIKARARALLA
jgi:mRNA interferase MazF